MTSEEDSVLLNDLHFAEMYLDHIRRRSGNIEGRARAQLILAIIKMLDARLPGWRLKFIQEIKKSHVTYKIEDLFTMPTFDEDAMFQTFLQHLISKEE